jgi:hypothetical protein
MDLVSTKGFRPGRQPCIRRLSIGAWSKAGEALIESEMTGDVVESVKIEAVAVSDLRSGAVGEMTAAGGAEMMTGSAAGVEVKKEASARGEARQTRVGVSVFGAIAATGRTTSAKKRRCSRIVRGALARRQG